jgi:acyl-coenzyme A synthetase/AMP-(fatty) acid ligase
VPKRIHFVSDLPRNAMGKVQKNRLREQLVECPAHQNSSESPA